MSDPQAMRPADVDIATEEERAEIAEQTPELGPDDEELPEALQDPDVEFELSEEDL